MQHSLKRVRTENSDLPSYIFMYNKKPVQKLENR